MRAFNRRPDYPASGDRADCDRRQESGVTSVTATPVTRVTWKCDIRHFSRVELRQAGAGRGVECTHRSGGRPQPRALGLVLSSEELKDERLGLRVVLAYTAPTEPAYPDRGSAAVPTIHPRFLPVRRSELCSTINAATSCQPAASDFPGGTPPSPPDRNPPGPDGTRAWAFAPGRLRFEGRLGVGRSAEVTPRA